MLALPQHVGMLFLVTCMFGSRNVDLVVEFCCLHVVVGESMFPGYQEVPLGGLIMCSHAMCMLSSLVTNWAQGGPWIARRFKT